jgi:hypothetical protein
MGKVSFCSIARRQRRRDLNWDRDEGRDLPEPSIGAEQVVITLGEMWHQLKKDL